MTPVTYDTKDGMPREVATSMLLEPRAKLSNRMRKTCRAARERTITSPTPIRRNGQEYETYETDPFQTRLSAFDKAVLKCRQLDMRGLMRLSHKSFRARIAIQKPFEDAQKRLAVMEAETDKAKVVRNARAYGLIAAGLQRLANEAKRLDDIFDAAFEETNRRFRGKNPVAAWPEA